MKKLRERLGVLMAEKKPLDEAMAKGELTAEQGVRLDAIMDECEGILAKIKQGERSASIEADASTPQPASVSLEIRNVADEAPYSFGEMLRDVRAAALGDGKSKRLEAHQKRAAFQMAASGANETVPSEGGFLVGKEMTDSVLTKVYSNSVLAPMCTRIGITRGNGIKINGVDESSRATGSRWGGIRGYWVAEGGSITGSKPKFRQLDLELKKVACLYYATDELLEDAGAFSQVAEMAVSEELAFMLQDSLVNGDGAGKPLGFLAAPCLTTVAKETGQAADTIVKANIDKMWSRAWGPSRMNMVWLINQEAEPQLAALEAAAGTGGIPAYLPPGGLADSPYGRLKGRPVIAIEQAAALGDVGDISLVDMSQYVLVDKGGVKAASSIHVQFLTDEQVFRFIYRVDGQPMWSSALTPYKGAAANTLSPFVTLAAR